MRYRLVCVVAGLVLGWVPRFLHGPIPYKYNILGIRGDTAVWGWYLARLLIGVWVGFTSWPPQWYLRGPLCGALAMLPLGIVSLATPGCGSACMFWNLVTATSVGTVVAAIAFGVTGRHRA